MQTRKAAALVLVTSLGLALATPATSEPVRRDNVPADLLAPVTPGARVRIEDADGRVRKGRYVATTDGDVVLDEPAARIPLVSIRNVWVRGRGVTTGAVIGGIVLAIPSALVGAALGAYCETECSDGDVYTLGGIGLAAGGAVGAVIGGLVGSAFPKWHRVGFGRAPAPKTGRGLLPGPIGSFSFQGGRAMGRNPNSGSGGLGGRLGLSAQLPGGLAPAVEFGRFELGRGIVTSPRGRALHFNESVTHFGLSLTKELHHGRMRPYGLASLGHYSSRGFNPYALNPGFEITNPEIRPSFFGASFGAGAHWRARRNLSLEMEGRWHTSLHRVAPATFDGRPQHWSMVSATAGATFHW